MVDKKCVLGASPSCCTLGTMRTQLSSKSLLLVVATLIGLNLSLYVPQHAVARTMQVQDAVKCQAQLAKNLPRPGDRRAGEQVPDCGDCTIVDSETDTYCEVRPGQDCGSGWNWFDDDFKWKRDVNIVRCPPDNRQYRSCGVWNRDGCCTDGTVGQPDPACGVKNGRHPCSQTAPNGSD